MYQFYKANFWFTSNFQSTTELVIPLDDSWQHARFNALLKGTKTIVDKMTADT